MSWKVTGVMEERFRSIEAYQQEESSLAELSRRFGVSRKTGYKWLSRYAEGGMEGAQDRNARLPAEAGSSTLKACATAPPRPNLRVATLEPIIFYAHS